jgi:hypothetical protein
LDALCSVRALSRVRGAHARRALAFWIELMGHEWQEYDPFHKACTRCGLRVFMRHQDGRVRGWQTVDWRGMPGPLMLAARGEPGGACTPPPAPPIPEPVIIEYTGDPDQHPGCERVMHVAGGLGSAAGLVSVTSLVPACGVLPLWWELGPARQWHGWNWCATCFPTREPHHVPRAGSWMRDYAVPLRTAAEIVEKKRAELAAEKLAAVKPKKSPPPFLRFPIPPRSCPVCRVPFPTGGPAAFLLPGHVVRVAKGELAGLVLLVCSRCAPKGIG